MQLSKSIILSITVFVLFAASCIKDHTTDITNPLPAFFIDTVGAPKSFQVYQSADKVNIDPKIVFDGDTAELTYQYRLYAPNNTFDTLARTRRLSSAIATRPGTYTLEYEVTHTKTGLKAFTQYTVVVLPPIPSGWMVMYEKDGSSGNTEIDVIRSPLFITATPAAVDSVYRGLYGTWNNGNVLAGTPRSILFTNSEIFAFTSNTGVGLQITDFRRLRGLDQMFTLGVPNPISPQRITTALQGLILIANKSVFWETSGSFVGQVAVTGSYEAAPFTYFQYGQNTGFYDQLNKRFLYLPGFNSNAQPYINANAGSRFNLNNIGKELLFVERSAGTNPGNNDPFKLAYFKDVTGNGRYVYIINTSTPTTPDVAVFDFTAAPDIQNALHFAAGNIGNTGFYATASRVYYYNYTNTPSIASTPEVGFTAPAGEEITCMRLHKSIGFSTVANDSKWLFVATWNATTKKGKVYFMEVGVTSGAINAPGGSWIVNGKVQDMTLKTS